MKPALHRFPKDSPFARDSQPGPARGFSSFQMLSMIGATPDLGALLMNSHFQPLTTPDIEIRLAQGHDPELLDDALSIAIDVIRAFTMSHCAFLRGAEQVFLYRSVEEARAAKQAHPDYVLAGERKSKKIEGFDIQNSPAEVSAMDLTGRNIILTTTNGVPSALNAMRVGRVLVTGFSNARVTAHFVREEVLAGRVKRINIVGSHPSGEEDMHCARFIERMIRGREEADDATRMRDHILASAAAQKFQDPAQPEFNAADMDFCVRENPSDFVMELTGDAHPVVRKLPL